MFHARSALVLTLSLALATPAAANDTGAFVVRLGQDTTGCEHYARTDSHLDIEQVGRAPRVLNRHITYDFGKGGAVSKMTFTVTSPSAPAGSKPVQVVNATFTADSVMLETRHDTTVQRDHFAVPSGTVVITGASPWSIYEIETMKLAKQKPDSLQANLYYVGAPNLASITLRRLGKDSVAIQTTNDLYHVRVDKTGQILNVVPIVGTAKFSVDRVASLDFAGMTAGFVAREQSGGQMGLLSPRDTVRATVAGASMWVDYSRPSKRGRAIFGGVVPWSIVWRTGANAATQFHTDKALQFGSQTLAAGTYTLWTLPSPTGWKFIVNSETGQWGTAHKPEKDMFSVDMKVSTLPASVEKFTIGIESGAGGGTLNLDWDTTRASVPFTVAP